MPDAETGELLRLNTEMALGDLPVGLGGAGAAAAAKASGLDARKQFAKARKERGLPAITEPPRMGLAVSAEEAAELHLLRARLDEQVSAAIKREEEREKHRQEMLAATTQKFKRDALRKEYAQERRQARREIENLRYDNEMALAHKLARMGLLK